MAYEFELTETLDDKFKKLEKRNKVLFMACRKKIMGLSKIHIIFKVSTLKSLKFAQDAKEFHDYKHLMHMDNFRVHVGGSFVITYRVFENKKLVVFLDLEHHDKAY